ncbi:tetratricopeptide repeat protein [Methylobacillus arboreus]|uniref:tetratricopeptide repeat protein n=1 Tax=Methylobacillus arboreus TaxID=755170 RepID=UPI001E3EB2F5|nr:tetratricopeptide repeat protein [Methylobacillus arboreus]MCB5191864.1 tetratricopeptide repeat protein [Methylobacillus arboreus]
MSATQLERFLGFLEQDPHNLPLMLSTADCAYQSGDLPLTKKLTQQALEIDDSNQQARALLGLSALAEGNIELAKSIFNKLIDQGITEPSIRYNLAYCLALEKQFQNSLNLLTDAEDQYPILPQMAHLKVQLHHHLAEIDEAIALALRIVTQYEEDRVLHGMLSSLYIDDMNFDAAKIHAEKAISSEQSNADAFSTLGTLALAEQDTAKASEYFSLALNSKQNHGRAWLGKAMAEMLQKNFASAIENLHSALQYMPNHLGTWQTLIWCYLAQHNIDQAEESTQQSLRVDPNFSETHGTLAIIHLIRGKIDDAQNSIRRALGLDRESFSGLYAQALLQHSQGNSEAAQVILGNLLDAEVLPNGISLKHVLTKLM